MKWEVTRDKLYAFSWRVEARPEGDDNNVLRAVFTGPGAEQRALDYCRWMNSKADKVQEG